MATPGRTGDGMRFECAAGGEASVARFGTFVPCDVFWQFLGSVWRVPRPARRPEEARAHRPGWKHVTP